MLLVVVACLLVVVNSVFFYSQKVVGGEGVFTFPFSLLRLLSLPRTSRSTHPDVHLYGAESTERDVESTIRRRCDVEPTILRRCDVESTILRRCDVESTILRRCAHLLLNARSRRHFEARVVFKGQDNTHLGRALLGRIFGTHCQVPNLTTIYT